MGSAPTQAPASPPPTAITPPQPASQNVPTQYHVDSQVCVKPDEDSGEDDEDEDGDDELTRVLNSPDEPTLECVDMGDVAFDMDEDAESDLEDDAEDEMDEIEEDSEMEGADDVE